MQKTIRFGLFLFLVTGMLFAGCQKLPADTTTNTDTTPVVDPSASLPANKYKDGSYTQTGSYTSPGGKDSMSVTLTIKDGLITAVSVTEMASNDTSKSYIEMFAGKISSLVVGKSIDSLGSIGAVNGSSLTPKGFNAAVEAIKSEAQA